jgi:hypothetical protein
MNLRKQVPWNLVS